MVKDEEITALLSRQYGVPSIDLAQFEIDAAIIKLVPADTRRNTRSSRSPRSGATLTIAMTDPTNVFAIDDIKFMTGYNVEPVVASETARARGHPRYYGTAPAPARGGDSGTAAAVRQRQRQQRSSRQAALRGDADRRRADDVEVLEELEEIDVDVARASRAARRRSSGW